MRNKSDRERPSVFSFTCGILKSQSHRKREENGGSQRLGNWGEVGQRVQTSSYNMNKFWGSKVQHGDDI